MLAVANAMAHSENTAAPRAITFATKVALQALCL